MGQLSGPSGVSAGGSPRDSAAGRPDGNRRHWEPATCSPEGSGYARRPCSRRRSQMPVATRSPDRNAIFYDTDGQVAGEATVGDGIEHVAVARSGHIWIGYFDEGVYGNYGWGDAETAPSVGAAGLVRFSPDLEPDWRFPSHVDQPWGAISDCYALNVVGDTVWACYYTDFPVVRVEAGTVTGWHNTIAHGIRALAVRDATVALFGGYGPDHDRLVVATLGQNRLHQAAEYRLVLPDGSPVPPDAQVVGRGPDLHLIVGLDRYRLGIDNVL